MRDGDASESDHADQVERVDLWVVGERSSRHRHQGIDGYAFGLRVKVGDDFEESKAIGDGFAEAEDATAADGDAGVLDVADGPKAIFVGVSGDDIWVVFWGGVEVVVVGGDACVAELSGFIGAELAEGDADFHVERGHVAADIEDFIELFGAAVDAFPSGAHAEASGASFFGGACVLHHLFAFHEDMAFEFGFVFCGLSAIRAVL